MDSNLIAEILRFRDERNWKQFHNPKDLAISISLEAAELLENFQWSTAPEAVQYKKENICDELADVLIYCILMADSLDVDINSIIAKKLEQNVSKYPVDKAFGKKEKYTDL
ncbi:MAG: nucleotide pyrophosphohydrolase [Bacillota bacterium]